MKSIVENTDNECYVCGVGGYLERHHIFGGRNRKLSEKYGLTVHLCWGHHQDSKIGVHYDPELMQQLHEKGQREFEKLYSREAFMKTFGKNYIREEPEHFDRQQDTGWGFVFLPEEPD